MKITKEQAIKNCKQWQLIIEGFEEAERISQLEQTEFYSAILAFYIDVQSIKKVAERLNAVQSNKKYKSTDISSIIRGLENGEIKSDNTPYSLIFTANYIMSENTKNINRAYN